MTTTDQAGGLFAPAAVDRIDLGDGAFVLRSPQPLNLTVRCLSDLLVQHASETPDRAFLMQRDRAGDWVGVTYAQALDQVRRLAGYLLAQGLGPDHPLLILSGNSVRHGVLMLAAMHVGIPVVPVSVPYSLQDQTLGKLHHIIATTSPGMVYVDSEAQFERAVAAVRERGIPVLSEDGAHTAAQALAHEPGPEVDAANASVTQETVGKILFTSGSTGMPKGVIVTQAMMLATQQALVQIWPFLEAEPPVIVDWLPWNHTFGGNFCFNLVLWNAGTFYIDDGRPLPGDIDRTMCNIREVSPTLLFNVPSGFDMMLPALRDDAELRAAFFARLRLIFYSGAGLPDHLWDAIEQMGQAERGEKIPFVSAWGATEAMLITCVHFPIPRAGVIGLPVPGYEVKFLPNGSKMEMRVRGVHVTPGYLNNPEKTAEAFDEDGYYLIGDAGRLQDDTDPTKGILFDGRISENFKLTTGTWVAVGALRMALIEALQPLVSDAVITGHDRDRVGALLFLNPETCADVAPTGTLADFAANADIRARIADLLTAYNAAQTGSATRVRNVMLMPDMPSVAQGEITDKGYINQRRVLELRADEVAALYSDGAGVISDPVRRSNVNPRKES